VSGRHLGTMWRPVPRPPIGPDVGDESTGVVRANRPASGFSAGGHRSRQSPPSGDESTRSQDQAGYLLLASQQQLARTEGQPVTGWFDRALLIDRDPVGEQ
jgi:hypothetical protein